MSHVVIVGTRNISTNPRLVRNADALAAAGFEVTVVYADLLPRFAANDSVLRAAARWKAFPVDFHRTRRARLRWQFVRVRRRIFSAFGAGGVDAVLQRAYGYCGPELFRIAAAVPGDFYFAQTQSALLPTRNAARTRAVPWGIDVEDLLCDCTDEPAELIAPIERRHFPHAALVTTMSASAADRLAMQHVLRRAPVVLHNSMPLAEGAEVKAPTPVARPLSLYWFGQTIGPHACAETVIEAIARLGLPATLTLRGINRHSAYTAALRERAARHHLSHALRFESSAPPHEMVRLASAHDVCLGTQPGEQLFHQLAIGNKVFTGMMAGCAMLLSDTIAHRRLLQTHSGWAECFPGQSVDALCDILHRLLEQPHSLQSMRLASWQLARSVYNWEAEAPQFIKAVNQTLERASP